ncbi:MAG TPA: hypothetical protein VKG21_13715 [Casimicrobiaceae bacterium]|nr:hypothetical protein [Casimicrobiaceae bacterium]
MMIPKTELAQAEGFSLWLIKAVFDGRASELIDMAHTNVPLIR